MTGKTKIELKKALLVYCVVIALMAVTIAVLGVKFYRYTNERLYEESVSQLEEISNHLLEKLDRQLELQWSYLSKLEEDFMTRDTMTEQEMAQELAHAQEDIGPYGKTILLRAIDSDGCYYTADGRQGLWTGLDKMSQELERQSFMVSSWLDTTNYMSFTVKNQHDLTVDGHKITHYVLLRSMEDMKPFFLISAFDNRNLSYIIDGDGTLLSQSGDLGGIDMDGRNVFYNMSLQTFPHMESFDEVLEKGQGGDTVCTDVTFNNNNNNYYLIYNRLPAYDWGVLILVQADDVASTTAAMVTSLTRIFVLFTIGMCLVIMVTVTIISRFRRNKKMLALSEENEHILGEANQLLTDANAKLSAAQKKAEEAQKRAEDAQERAEDAQKRAEESQKKAEDALKVAESATKAKSQFLANMSHDIRTPMNAIMGVTKLMEHDVENPDKLRYYLDKLQHSGTHMLGLINDILDMSKIESGEVHLAAEPVDMADQVAQVESIIRSQSSEKNQTFTVTSDITHEYLIGDSMRLRQLFINLLNNAVKYTQEGGDIRFELTELECDIPDHATILTSVIDNGYGMSADFLKRIFEPFTRAENSTTNKIQGTGLGMSIVKNIVDLMGGSITVESELDKGSRFDVLLTLPIDADAAARAAAKNAHSSAEDEHSTDGVSILQGRRFLCAEDNDLNAEVLEALLDIYGASCTICSDGEKIVKAFENVKEGDYDAILMDVQMPNMNGLDATRAIRTSSNLLGRTIPIIAMTANAFSSDIQDCLDAGMDAHVAKPLDIAILEKILAELLK